MEPDSPQHRSPDKELAAIKAMMTEQIRYYSFQNDHIMRGPLCRVMGLLELLRREDVSPEARKMLDMLTYETRQIENVTYLIGRMLDEYETKLDNTPG